MKKQFADMYKFSDHDINKFILLLWNVYPNEYMDDWEKFDDTLPEKEDFYSNLNMEDITVVHYMHAKRVEMTFEIKNIHKYHDKCIQKICHC